MMNYVDHIDEYFIFISGNFSAENKIAVMFAGIERFIEIYYLI